MAFVPSVAVFDACILYPFHLRNIIVQAVVDLLIEAHWTDAIHEEWIRNLATAPSIIPIARLQRTRRLMNEALPTAMVSGYEDHVAAVNLPDPNDRHVVAAGIAAGASIIHTWYLRHCPAKELKKFGLRTETPDAFLSGLHDQVPDLMGRLSRKRSPEPDQEPGFGFRFHRDCPQPEAHPICEAGATVSGAFGLGARFRGRDEKAGSSYVYLCSEVLGEDVSLPATRALSRF
jgi:hypothetical protein